jgi:hypothetical protein
LVIVFHLCLLISRDFIPALIKSAVFIISFSGCDICLARLFFRVGMNVLLSPKAERPPQTRHDCAVFLDRPSAVL